jgi:hypothetical protein
MSTQGPNLAGSGSGWNNSGNILAADGAYADGAWDRIFVDGAWEADPTPYLTASGFGFSLGAGDTPNGITVEVKAHNSGPSGTLYAFLAVGGVQYGATKSGAMNSAGDVVFTFGSSVDAWGSGMSGTNINNLQVVLYGQPSGGSGVGSIFVDYVKVTVDFTDTTPNAFDFTDITNRTPSVLETSDSQTITGISAASPVSLSNNFGGTSEWEKNNSGSWSSKPGTVVNGDSVRVRHLNSPSYGVMRNTTLTVGGVSGDFKTTTIVADQTCDAFSFPDTNGVNPSSAQGSGWVQITGINVPTPFTVTAARRRSTGATAAAGSRRGNVNNGDFVYLTRNASSLLQHHGLRDAQRERRERDVEHHHARGEPHAERLYLDGRAGRDGLDGLHLEHRHDGRPRGRGHLHLHELRHGHHAAILEERRAFLALPANVALANGDTLQLRVTAPAGSPQTHNITTDIGSPARTDTWSVTTGDNTPDAFSFAAKSGPPGTSVQSAAATINGINVAAAVNATTARRSRSMAAAS